MGDVPVRRSPKRLERFERLRQLATSAGIQDTYEDSDLGVISDLIVTSLDGLRGTDPPDNRAIEVAANNIRYAVREFEDMNESSINGAILQSIVDDLDAYLREN